MVIIVISFLSTLLKYLRKGNTIPQHLLACIFCQKYDMLAYFALVLLYRDGNRQFWCQNVSASLLVCFFVHMFLFNHREPDNAELLHVYLPDCVRVTNKLD